MINNYNTMKACKLSGAHGVFDIILIEITYRSVRLPEGFSHYVKYPELTENQAKALVGQFIYNDPDYGDLNVYPNFKDNTFEQSAIRSFDTLIEVNGIVFENPLGIRYSKMPDAEMDYRSFLRWREAQQKVWDKNCTHIYIR